jgi:ubiquinone/menaquinone biosynthesis C-methylase UbiE
MRAAIAPQRLRRVYADLAGRYDLQHGLLTLGSDARGRRLVARRTVSMGDAVLDAGAGTGSTALMAARLAGPEGRVTLADFSPEMLREARRKLAAAGYGARAACVAADMAALPFPDAQFDAVLSTYSLCPLTDPEDGARELWRVTKPGGLIGVAHSATPRGRVMHWLAERLDDAIFPFPALSMGCRAVNVRPALARAGAEEVFVRRIGVPLYPFLVFVMRKPAV